LPVVIDDHQLRLPRFAEPAPETAAGLNLADLAERAPQRDAFERDRDAEDGECNDAVGQRLGMVQALPSFIDREQAADEEQQQRDHHRPEVDDTEMSERVMGGRRRLRLLQSEQQQQLIGRVGDRVDRLCQHGAGAGVGRGAELRHRDARIGAECEEDGFRAVGCHSMVPVS
jgi:hypothetical protein